MKEIEEQILQEVLQRLTWYFAESIIHEGIVETQLAKKDQVEELNVEEQGITSEEVMEEKKPNFKA